MAILTGKRILDRHSLPFLAGWALQRGLRMLSARMRTLPDFVIIGGQRCGTTSLYNYLMEHPLVLPAFMKETHFFDTHYHRGINWYRAFFPLAIHKKQSQQPGQQGFLTGESSPYYLFYPHAPSRLLQTIPQARLIALLRNPVERAYSHYHHEVNMGIEKLSFEDALQREEKELPAEAEKVWQDGNYRSFAYQNYSYLARGIYQEQLERWTKLFSRERLLVLKSEDLYDDPGGTLRKVAEFLDLPPWQLSTYKPYNLARYAPLDASTKERLMAYFEPHNQRLYEFLGVDLGWE
jgi:hypothetical protein